MTLKLIYQVYDTILRDWTRKCFHSLPHSEQVLRRMTFCIFLLQQSGLIKYADKRFRLFTISNLDTVLYFTVSLFYCISVIVSLIAFRNVQCLNVFLNAHISTCGMKIDLSFALLYFPLSRF